MGARRVALLALASAIAGCGDGDGVALIVRVDPGEGPARGGDAVVIEGAGLATAIGVRFGDRPARSFTVRDDGAVDAISPAAIAGEVDVTVDLAGGGAATRPRSFVYRALDLAFVEAPAFTLPVDPAWGAVDLAPADFDGDGTIDLYVARRGAPGRVLFGDGLGGFRDRGEDMGAAARSVRAAVAADVDGDGLADVVLCNDGGEPSTLLRGDGTGTLREDAGALPPTADECAAIAVTDVDADGRVDVVLLGRGRAGRGQSYVRVLAGTTDPGEAAASLVPVGALEPAPKGDALPCDGFVATGATCTLSREGAASGLRAARVEVDATAAAAKATLVTTPPDLAGAPASISLSARALAGAATLGLVVVDAAGETFRRALGRVDFADWKTTTTSAVATFAHEGGDGDGVVDLPIASITITIEVEAGAKATLSLDDLRVGLPTGGAAVVDDFERVDFALAWDGALRALAVGDATGDGTDDLVVGGASPSGPAAHLAIGLPGQRRFALPNAGALGALADAPTALALVDADHDGDLDLLALSDGQDRLFTNDGTAHFVDATALSLPVDRAPDRAFAAADLDLDGRLDLALAADGGQSRLYLGRDGGRFLDATPALPLGAAATTKLVPIDVDSDGDLDLVALRRAPEPSRILIASNRAKGDR